MSSTGLIGFIMMMVMMLLLVKSRIPPAVVFSILPLVTGIMAGFKPLELYAYITEGVSSVFPVAIMFGMAMIFFGLLGHLGVFSYLIGRLLSRKGDDARSIMVITVLISAIGHLSGSGAVSYLLIIKSCRPIYEQKGIPLTQLMCLSSLTLGVMNMVPWAGPCGRIAGALQTGVIAIWRYCIPAQMIGLCVILLIAIYLAEKQNIVGKSAELKCSEATEDWKYGGISPELEEETVKPKHFMFNWGCVITAILILSVIKIPPSVVFGIGSIVVIIKNYGISENGIQAVKKNGIQALQVVITVLSTGFLVGILAVSPLMDGMTHMISAVMPGDLMRYAHILMGILANPISWFISGEVQIFGLVPLAAEFAAKAGIPAAAAGAAYLIPYSTVIFVLPTTVSVQLGLSLCGLKLKDHVRITYKWSLLCSLLMLGISVVIGVIPI